MRKDTISMLPFVKPPQDIKLKFKLFGTTFEFIIRTGVKARRIFEQPSMQEINPRLCWPSPPYTQEDIERYIGMLEDYSKKRSSMLGTFSDYS